MAQRPMSQMRPLLLDVYQVWVSRMGLPVDTALGCGERGCARNKEPCARLTGNAALI